MMHLTVKESGTLGILTLRGNLIEHSADELQIFLSRALDHVNRLIVNCEQVTAVDVDRLRLLCTTYRVSQMYKKEFALVGSRNAAFLSALKAAGYDRCPGGERAACEAGCLWTENDPRPYCRDDASAYALEQDAAES